jgi:hypothetical protein
MAFFKRKEKVIDLSERMRKQHERIQQLKEDMKAAKSSASESIGTYSSPAPSASGNTEPSNGSFFNFFGNNSDSSSSSNSYANSSSYSSENEDDKRKKLAKRLGDMTARIEEISTKLYKIEQRLELIEHKMGIDKY